MTKIAQQDAEPVCLRTDGRVMSVGAMNGVPGLDGEISQQIQQSWVYKPQQVPVCFVAMVTFKIN